MAPARPTSLAFVAAVAAVAALVAGPARADSDLATLLPDEIAGYRADGGDRLFDRDTLFDLIDGAAEVYRALDVRAVISRQYVNPKAADIMVDLFDMGSDSDAFGAYHHDLREGRSAGVGNESEQEGGTLFFWKDRYFVSIVALEDDARTRKAARAIGRRIAAAIPRRGEPPALVAALPRKGLITSQVHYFHGWKLLARHYRFGESNPLGLGAETEGVLARYRRKAGGETARLALMLIRYPSAAAAAEARTRFDTEQQAETRTGMAVAVADDILMIALDAPTEAAARALIREVRIPKGGLR